MHQIINSIVEFLSVLPKELVVLIISAFPIVELRGAIPVGISLGMDPIYSAVLSFVGSSLPAPFILLAIKPILEFLKRFRFFKGFIERLLEKSMKKSEKVEKMGALGLMLFVAIPLPGTGAWTGSLIGALLCMKFRYAFPAVVLGNAIAGVIVTIASYGIFSMF